KMYDLHVWAGRGLRPGLRQFAACLPNEMWMVYGSRPPAADGREWSRLARRAMGFVLGVTYGVAVFSVNWTRLPFAFEHAAKALVFYFVALTLTLTAASVWRLCGGHAFDPIDHAAGAATPGEFWRRWNRPVHRWIHVHVFEPAGGCRAPVRATLA